MSRDAVIVEAVRTPLGRRKGALSGVHPADLSAAVLRELATRSGIDPGIVDDVVWGCVSQVAEQTFNTARTAVLSAGWPEHVPGVTVDRQCGSSQQAVSFAAAGVIAGHYDVVVAGGVESMSRVPMFSAITEGSSPLGADYARRYGPQMPNQGIGAEMVAQSWQLPRAQLDEYSVRSHERAAQATDSGAFKKEIVPITLPDGTVVDTDEGIRRDTSMERLSQLKAAFRADGVITAGNSSQISDGAAALLIVGSDVAAAHGLTPLARVRASAVIGAEPMPMLTAPIPATRKLLERANLTIRNIGAFEVNEAFASVPLAWLRELGADPERMNPNGGSIALGHPLGGSGARLATSLIHHMLATGTQLGLQTMCEAGGQANATLFELV
jgi:acetyl-CoA acyltransferase